MLDGHEQLSEIELANRAVKGDEIAFAEIVRRFSPRVFHFASRFFRERALVEEAAQEVFLRVFTQLKNFEGRGSLEGWLTRITTNTCLNLLRSARRQPELTISNLSEDESQWLETHAASISIERQHLDEEKVIAADLVHKVLATMSPDDQLVLMRIDGEGISIKEIAEQTGWSESKVKVTAFRARRKMREATEKLLNGAAKKNAGAAKVNR
ncbi:MAG: RNA polymerase sigma factor [Pyrinomonadaceae bacterium]